MHRLLKRQIKQVYGKDHELHHFDEKTLALLREVTETYQNFDTEKAFLNDEVQNNRRKIKEAYDNMLTSSRLVAIGEMMENITHQWKQPLSVILNIITIMKLEMKHNRDLEVIEQQTRYLDDTIKNFTNFSSHSEDEKVFFELAKSIEETTQMFNFQSKTHRIVIENHVEKGVYVQGDIGKFNQAILVIFSNAKDAFVGKGIEDRSISIHLSIVENTIKLHLQDNAGGIKEEVIDRIFEPYFTTKFKDKGTGIGLSMTYKIIQQMKGTIQARNHAKGAEFIITLPRKYYKKDENE